MVSSDEINKGLRNKRIGKNNEMNCPSCGSENPPGSRFCKECGKALTTGAAVIPGRSPPVAGTSGSSVTDKSPSAGTGKPHINAVKPAGMPKPGARISKKPVDGPYPGTDPGKPPENRSFLGKIPGFRSRTPWKMFLGGALYFLVLIFVVLLVIGSLLPSYPTIEVAGSQVTLVNNNSSTNDGMMINATIKGNGNVTVLPVGVYSDGEYIGTFLMTNVTPNKEMWFRMNVAQDNDGVMTIKDSNGKVLRFYPGYNYTDTTFSTSPGSYKLIIGDTNASMTPKNMSDFLHPMVSDYNKTKGSQSDNITIQGTVVGDYTFTSSVPLGNKMTIILKLDDGKLSQGERVYTDSGETVTAWQYYEDIVIISWPDLKILGWHRFKGTAVPDSGYGYGGDIYGDPVYESNITDWINSLRRN
jgi:hypothetical protein